MRKLFLTSAVLYFTAYKYSYSHKHLHIFMIYIYIYICSIHIHNNCYLIYRKLTRFGCFVFYEQTVPSSLSLYIYIYISLSHSLSLFFSPQVKPIQHTDLQEVRRGIRKCFKDINCYLMPEPGSKAKKKAFDGKLAGE